MASEQFSLCWDNFHKNMSSGMNSLLENEDFVDVTLAVDGRYLKAHKMVLSVCSPYFRELFKMNPCQHPIVFMKDVSYTAMYDLLQFMYQGEVQISQENLTTFIKTAEALQIKGLTDGTNNQFESDQEEANEVPPIERLKSKKIQSFEPSPQPPVKRQRTSNQSSSQHQPQQKEDIITPNLSKTESVINSSNNNNDNSNSSTTIKTQNTEEIVQFKLEPYDQSQSITINDDDDQDEFNDDQLDDKNCDDLQEDYTMMEGGDDEPKAGTSDEQPGEGQGDDDELVHSGRRRKSTRTDNADGIPKKRINRMRFIVDGFVYHNNVIAGTPPLRYLGCAEHKRSGCRGRATIPVGGTLDMLRMTQQHNHPPDINAQEKDEFIKELKKAVRSSSLENVTVKKVYETVALAYPKAAEEISFRSLSSSLHRWRKDPYL